MIVEDMIYTTMYLKKQINVINEARLATDNPPKRTFIAQHQSKLEGFASELNKVFKDGCPDYPRELHVDCFLNVDISSSLNDQFVACDTSDDANVEAESECVTTIRLHDHLDADILIGDC